MDITLCRIEKSDKQVKEIVVSSARQAFYYFNMKQNKLHKMKGDVKSVGGKYYEDVIFTDKYLKLRKGDMLYLLSDGFIDQDSPEGKKIGSNSFFEYLEHIAPLPVKKQKKKLIEFYNEHKKDNHQRDDITILGIKIGK
jgi:serine phosphatase RsbU (regulator of sigma subunit)